MNLNPKVLLIIVTLVGFCAVKLLFGYIAPFLLGILIATMIDPAVDSCEHKGCPRQIASLLLVVCIFGGLLLFVAIAVVGFWYELGQLLDSFQLLRADPFQDFARINQLISRLPGAVQNLIPAAINSISQFCLAIIGELFSLVKRVPALLFSWMIAAMTAFFVSRDKRAIVNFVASQLPRRWQKSVFGLKHTLLQGVFAYIKAQLFLMWTSICIAVSGFLIVDHQYAWVLGFIAGFLDLFPMIGPSGVFIPVILYNLARGLVQRAVFIGFVWLLLLLVRQLSEPQLIGGEIGLHPLSTMAAVYIGVKLMGFSGVLLGPMAMIFCKAVYLIVSDAA
ncbi:MAG: AI-2E family transporter [Firmicutes bacterium]|jgi:sporulation integral membrane protein YtvI|nr:AI-2E family transporter [Bacillota bacterium]NLL88060.1 AI-2E family transporter [Bacillota bacterium]